MADHVGLNEEIVNELTKDLSAADLDTGAADLDEEISEAVGGEEIREETSADDADDVVDEERLKDLELALTDEEKEARKVEAIEKKNEGNELFKKEEHAAALGAYTEGLLLCPLSFPQQRSIIYSNRAAAKIKLGRTKSALQDCDKAIELDPQYVRAVMRRAKLREDLEMFDEALADWKLLLELQPGLQEAVAASQRLPPIIEERNEKLKADMLDKLKSLGNMVLRPFGLSTNNFKMVPNGEGGYSVQFEQNQ